MTKNVTHTSARELEIFLRNYVSLCQDVVEADCLSQESSEKEYQIRYSDNYVLVYSKEEIHIFELK
jgi:hypothetical protein